MALGGRIALQWKSNAGDYSTFVVWNAREIAQRFAMQADEHLGIVKVKAFQDIVTSGVQQLVILADAMGLDEEALETGVLTSLESFQNVEPNANTTSVRSRKVLSCIQEADNFADVDIPNEPVEVFENLVLVKAAAAEWQIIIDFVYLDGAMRWPIENFMDDFNVVPRQRSPGSPFYQAGDMYVEGEREY